LFTNYIQKYKLSKQNFLFSKQVKENKFTNLPTVKEVGVKSSVADKYRNTLCKL